MCACVCACMCARACARACLRILRERLLLLPTRQLLWQACRRLGDGQLIVASCVSARPSRRCGRSSASFSGLRRLASASRLRSSSSFCRLLTFRGCPCRFRGLWRFHDTFHQCCRSLARSHFVSQFSGREFPRSLRFETVHVQADDAEDVNTSESIAHVIFLRRSEIVCNRDGFARLSCVLISEARGKGPQGTRSFVFNFAGTCCRTCRNQWEFKCSVF